MQKSKIILTYAASLVLVFGAIKAKTADFNPNILIPDEVFVNINDMDIEEIQIFLDLNGGILKDYSENGRKAAQIIYDASHGFGNASGISNDRAVEINDLTGTVNPKVLLVTLQKEQSLITRADYSQYSLDWATGYGCPKNCPPAEQYRGFTKQVENAAWQLRYNYERAQGINMVGYQVGETIHLHNTFPNPYGAPPEQDVRLDNRATASLYRYTPQVYNANYNFWRIYNQWFAQRK